ncbi:MAG: undecaprenyldiphospho-muramoylpentapeptide beta-N-acetylglucosaminyltransferase [Clostridia bacterium]
MKIILTGGGTAGHVTPNIALLPYLSKSFDKIFYIGSEQGIEKQLITNEKIPYYPISSTKFVRKKFFKNLKIPFVLIKAIHQAKKIIKQTNPDIVFSKGGYVSVPVVIASYLLKIPVICHESDLSLGLANKFSAIFAKKVCTTFEKTAKSLKKGIFTGAPIRELKSDDYINKLKTKYKTSVKPLLLVTGGSQGARKLNELIRNNLTELTKTFNVLHLCGKNNLSGISINGYTELEYSSDLLELISISSLVISRSGSNTIFEIASLRTPMILVPLPKGNSRGDQVENANYFKTKGIAEIVNQDTINNNEFISLIIKTYNNRINIISEMNKLTLNNGTANIAKVIVNNVKTIKKGA